MKIAHLYEASGYNMTGIHYSRKPSLTKLDPQQHGTGIIGAERKRARDYPEYYNNERLYFYKADSDFVKEPGLGNNEYLGQLTKIYDMRKDPDRLGPKAKERSQEISGPNDNLLTQTLFENMVVEAGYNGYWDSRSNIIIYFKPVYVKEKEAA